MFSRPTPPSPAATPASATANANTATRQRQALQLAGSINVLLLRELDQGVDPGRLLADPLYARDVLLVCDAYVGSELAALAQQFRAAVRPPQAQQTQQTQQTGTQAAARKSATSASPARPVPTVRQQLRDGQESGHENGHDSGRDSSGFGMSRFFNSLFGPLMGGDGNDAADSAHATHGGKADRGPTRMPRPWFGRDRGTR